MRDCRREPRAMALEGERPQAQGPAEENGGLNCGTTHGRCGRERQQKAVLDSLRKDLETMRPRVQQVIGQAKARVLGGDVPVPGRRVSVFEPSPEVIRKGKASQPTEFGQRVKIQEAENQIVTGDEVFEKRPQDSDLLMPAVSRHQGPFGRVPELRAGDAAF